MPRAILLAALALLVLGPASAGSAPRPTAAGMPVWSPDSKSLAFTGVVEPSARSDVFIANVATGATVDVTANSPARYRASPVTLGVISGADATSNNRAISPIAIFPVIANF